MKKSTTFALDLTFAFSAAVGLVLLSTPPVVAQVAGNNAVFNSGTLTGSPAFIDASVLPNGDICSTINHILRDPKYPVGGAVIDARGILATPGYSAQICATNPFDQVTNPSVVLLPPSTMCIEKAWQLPDNTRLIGEGTSTLLRACRASTSNCGQTNVCTATFGDSDMIDMSSSTCTISAPCSGISVEHMALDGQDLAINGIANNSAQESSFVNDVKIANIQLIGLSVESNATGSGPYSNIDFQCPDCSDSIHPTCVSILATTRGLHGITCIAASDNNNSSGAAIALDANYNSIEDVHIEGFYDGVLIGSRGNAQGNVLLNIHAASGGSGSGPVFNAVHICKPHGSTICPSLGTVTDLALFDIENIGAAGGVASATILDDLTSTQVNYTPLNSYVGMYVIGNNKQVTNGYSRFTTAPGCNLYTNSTSCVGGIPTFVVGGSTPTGSCSTPGVIYSNTAGTKGSSNTVFVCKSSAWKRVTM